MLIARITARVVRGYELGQWGLSSHQVDDDSSLAADDRHFMPELGPRLVSSTARFPAMGASEQLLAAGQVHAEAITDGKLRTQAVATLCRAAVEASAKTIWLLGDTSRDVRRARCLGFIAHERNYQLGFLSIEEKVLNERTDNMKATDYQGFLKHRQELTSGSGPSRHSLSRRW